MRFFQQLAQQLRQVWLTSSVVGRVGFIVLSGVCLAAIGGVGYWAAQPDYRVLFSGLSADDAGAITAKLQAQAVPFSLGAGGTTISVPAAQLQQARVDLAVAGLPSGGAKGFEILENAPLGVTPFMQHVNYTRAMQAELAKTIMQLEPVSYARVHIVRPESTPFVRDQKPATASVVLKLKPGATVGRNVAAGIVALVARSVEGLAAEGVTVLDTSGRVLSEQPNNGAAGLASSQLEYRREVETYLASKAEDMLAQMLGAGRAIVKVTAEINFKRVKEKRENYDPDSRLATKEKVSNKKSTASSSARGPAGTASNLGKGSADPGSTGTGMQEEETESEYIFSKTTLDQEQPAGNIERLTVAAMVDLSGGEAGGSGQAKPVMTLKEAEEIVKRAVGLKPERDEIKVSDVKLAGTAPSSDLDGEWLQAQRWQTYEKIARHSSLGVAALVALVLGRMVLKRLQVPPQPGRAAVVDQADRSRVIQQLSNEAQRNPEAVAGLLANWLDEADQARKAAA